MNAYEIAELWIESTFKYWEETANILQENLDRLYDACKEYENRETGECKHT